MTDEDLKRIEQELETIKQRNTKVEADKAWEGSFFRISCICVITYAVVALLLFVIGTDRFWLGAIVPVFGFLLSTQSLPALKRWWINSRYQPK